MIFILKLLAGIVIGLLLSYKQIQKILNNRED